jgi:diguanylate cyclase (GGDEF)-like protein/PAS domain S-box-containing protein
LKEFKKLQEEAHPTTGRQAKNLVAILVWLFAFFLAVLSGLAIMGIGLQSGVRAYVGGEGLWSKAEKDAVFDLDQYLSNGDEEAFRRFEHRLSVPLGDRRAREELQKKSPDFRIAADGFIEGRNHRGDVAGMMRLFRSFRWLPEMGQAIDIWTRGDALIVELRELADRIHAASSAGTLDSRNRAAFASELQRLNERLTIVEDDFSATLGVAARRVNSLLVTAIVGIGLLLAAAGLFVARRIASLLVRSEAELSASERRHRELFERSPAGLYRVNLDGRLLACNSALARLIGYESKEDVLALSLEDLFGNPLARQGHLDDLPGRGNLVNHEVCLKRRDGQLLWVLLNESVLRDAGGEQVLEGSLIDISNRKQMEEINQYRATHDPLTDLPNRALFTDRLSVAIRHARRRDQLVAVIFLDLDDFKAVNDTYGHAVGDEILIQAGRRLTSSLRAEDTVARFGGDEFVLLIAGGVSKEDLPSMARKILERFSEPFVLKGLQLAISASAGISLYPNDAEEIDTLVANADAALYRAKNAGRKTFRFFAQDNLAPQQPIT